VAYDENYISEDNYNEFNSKINEEIKILNGYINFLKRQKSEATR